MLISNPCSQHAKVSLGKTKDLILSHWCVNVCGFLTPKLDDASLPTCMNMY